MKLKDIMKEDRLKTQQFKRLGALNVINASLQREFKNDVDNFKINKHVLNMLSDL